ncbi:MAG TPA: DNA helicase RecQ [Spirochaetia bacterium]|nr:DNA helicase RecQ [Spirochaetia bacterium]
MRETMPSPQEVLKKIFGYDQFRPFQEEIIQSVLDRQDTLIIMPTGGGKSLCYQIPALVFENLTVVVSPLISLMKDQVDQLKELGVNAVLLNSSISRKEYRINIEKIVTHQSKLVYLAPETLLKEDILELFSKMKIDAVAVDESHCLSEWGHDFRPEYRQIAVFRKHHPEAVFIALTATATERVREDIQIALKMKNPKIFISSFDRNNLFLQIAPKHNAFQQVSDFLKKFKNQSGIIYCFSREHTEKLTEKLAEKGYSVKAYHAGLSDKERQSNQELFVKDDVQIIVATIAFGMGINKPDVRFVIHYDLPKSVESYYQEIGRAGRDGLPAYCLLLFSYADVHKIKFIIDKKENPEQKTIARKQLNQVLSYCETYSCRRKFLIEYFGERYQKENCEMCDTCTDNKFEKQTDLTIPAKKLVSCIMRTGQKFGIGHVIDVLRGSKAKKIIQYGHDKLSTYNIGNEYSADQWKEIGRQMIEQGFLVQDEEYRTLSVAPKTKDLLKDQIPFLGIVEQTEILPEKKKISDEIYDEELFELLRKTRKIIADEKNIPPYIVFTDRTLIEIAKYYPVSEVQFLSIHGIQSAKLNEYGHIFIPLVKEFVETKETFKKKNLSKENKIEEKSKKMQLLNETIDQKVKTASLLKELSQLADEYETALSEKKKQESKIEALKQKIIEKAEKENLTQIKGSQSEIQVTPYEKILLPDSKDPNQQELIRLLKLKGLYESYSMLNSSLLKSKIKSSEILEEDILKFAEKTTDYKITLKQNKKNSVDPESFF